MARYIDAEKLLSRMKQDPLFPIVDRYGISGVIEAEPTADVVEVRHGKWLVVDDDLWRGGGRYECSACGFGFSFGGFFEMNTLPYCPHCGAKMEVPDEEPT